MRGGGDRITWLATASLVTLLGIIAVGPARSYFSAGTPLPLVPTTSTADVLALIREGKRVVFIDAREPEEFRESRIPGAINLTLRELLDNPDVVRRQIGDPDLVIAYCLKDFRGFEVARALQSLDVKQARTLSEAGIKGWVAAGLPTASSTGLSDAEATVKLDWCARNPANCTSRPSP